MISAQQMRDNSTDIVLDRYPDIEDAIVKASNTGRFSIKYMMDRGDERNYLITALNSKGYYIFDDDDTSFFIGW